jgi:hypothetical protein
MTHSCPALHHRGQDLFLELAVSVVSNRTSLAIPSAASVSGRLPSQAVVEARTAERPGDWAGR